MGVAELGEAAGDGPRWSRVDLGVEQPVILGDGLYSVDMFISPYKEGERLVYVAVQPLRRGPLDVTGHYYLETVLLANSYRLEEIKRNLEGLPYRFQELMDSFKYPGLLLMSTTSRIVVRYGFLASPPGPRLVYVPEPGRMLVVVRDLGPFLDYIRALPKTGLPGLVSRLLEKRPVMGETGITYVFG